MKKFRIIAIFVVLAMLTFAFSSSAVSITVNYTALGDSIAVGAGGNDLLLNNEYGYVDRLIERDSLAGPDLSQNGLTSAGLLANLTDPSDSDYIPTLSALSEAAVVTVSIGGNDLLQVFAPLYNNDPDFLNNLTYWQRHTISLQLMLNTRSFGPNWRNIIKNIRLQNDEADVYVNTLYNPFSIRDPLFYFADPFIRTINASIWAYAGIYDYEVVDVYTAFRGKDGMVHDIDGDVPLHPTNDGYEVIYDLHKALMD